jgi:hypothetical protein
MPIFTIPDEFKPALALMVSLTDEAVEELSTQLENAPLSFTDGDLADSVATKAKGLPSGAANTIIETLVSLHWVRTSAEVPLDEFVADIAEGIEKSDLKESISKFAPDEFKRRLARLLGIKTVAFAAKAREIQRTYEHSFCTAEMLTDIRPIFESNGEGTPMAAVLLHTLKISYHQRNELKDFFLALTSDDLDTLEELIDKARDESQHLESILDAAKLSYPKVTVE